MPQPDNKREYGSTTQGSQRTVAPQGQKAADISPVSGGAASAAPVLQIGQQAQIKQTGAELFQALGGAFQGISQGIQNYEKMYEMVSKRDYANFESDYYAEQERVHNDPKLMQDWMESSRYKPNRVTAGSYQRLRAGVYQRDYEAQQQDDILSMQQAMVDKPLHEQISYLGDKLDSYEPDSPAYKWIEQTQLKAGTTAAAQSRAVSIGSQTLEAKNKNIELAGQILATNRNAYGDVITTPRFRLALQAKALGLADIKQNEQGQWIFETLQGQQYDLSALPADLDASLAEGIGQAGIEKGNDYVEGMLKASILPASVFNAGGGARNQNQVDSMNAFNALPSGESSDLIRGSDNPVSTAGSVSEMVYNDSSMDNPQKREYLLNVLATFEAGAMSDEAYEQIESTLPDGVTDKRAAAEKMLRDLKDDINAKIYKVTSKQYNDNIISFANDLDKATNPNQARGVAAGHAMKMGVLPENSEAMVLGISIGANGFPTPVATSLDNIPPGFIPVGFTRPLFDESGMLPKGDVQFTMSDGFIQETLGNVKYLNEEQQELAAKAVERITDWGAFEAAAQNPNLQIEDARLARIAGIEGATVTVETAQGEVAISPLDYILRPETAVANLSGTATALSGQAYNMAMSTVAELSGLDPEKQSKEYGVAMMKLQRISDVYKTGNYGEKVKDPEQRAMLSQGFLVAKIASETNQDFSDVWQQRANFTDTKITKAANDFLDPAADNPRRDQAYESLYNSSYTEDMNSEDPEKNRQALYWKNEQIDSLTSNPWLAVSASNNTFTADQFDYNSHAVPFDPMNTYSLPGRPQSLTIDVMQTLVETKGWLPEGSEDPVDYLRLLVNQATDSSFSEDEFRNAYSTLSDPTTDGGMYGPVSEAIDRFVADNFDVGKSDTPPSGNRTVNENGEPIRHVRYPIKVKSGSEIHSVLRNTNIAIRREISGNGIPLTNRRTSHEVQQETLTSQQDLIVRKAVNSQVKDVIAKSVSLGPGVAPGAATAGYLASPILQEAGSLAAEAAVETVDSGRKIIEAVKDNAESLIVPGPIMGVYRGTYGAVKNRISELWNYYYR